MELSMTEQATVFLFSCAVGVFLGAFYDIFRIIRIAFNSRWLSIFFQDFIFCIFSAFTVMLLVYYTNSGIVRWFSLAGCFLCFLLYHMTVGRLVMFMAKKIIAFIRKVLNFIKSVTVIPAFRLIFFIIKLLKRLALYIIGQMKKSKKYKYYKKQMKAAEREAAHGFDLYKYKKVSGAVSRAAKSEIKMQAKADRTQIIRERGSTREKTRLNKRKNTRTLGSLKSLSSIKFK